MKENGCCVPVPGTDEIRRRLRVLDFALDRTVNTGQREYFRTLQDMFLEYSEMLDERRQTPAHRLSGKEGGNTSSQPVS